MAHDVDLGLFGPDSVSWRVHAEPILWVAGLRALFLQSLHPRAIAGVVQNSDYRHDPWGRLMRTAEYVGTVVYGTTEDARRADTDTDTDTDTDSDTDSDRTVRAAEAGTAGARAAGARAAGARAASGGRLAGGDRPCLELPGEHVLRGRHHGVRAGRNRRRHR